MAGQQIDPRGTIALRSYLALTLRLGATDIMLATEDRDWIAEQLAKLSHDVFKEIARVEAGVERVETSLLTEFHKWASPLEQRMRTHREALRALDMEMVDLSERVQKLEPKQ
jgi:hypothetical protein